MKGAILNMKHLFKKKTQINKAKKSVNKSINEKAPALNGKRTATLNSRVKIVESNKSLDAQLNDPNLSPSERVEIAKEFQNGELKHNFVDNMISDRTFSQLFEMGNSLRSIHKWQIKRILFFVFMIILGAIMAVPLKFNIFYGILGGFGLGSLFYYVSGKSIQSKYDMYSFNRALSFSKFSRLLIPYLTQLSNGTSLYSIFYKMLPRMETDDDRRLLRNLMKSMTDNQNDIKPFIRFANDFSGSDDAVIFMQTIFDMYQGSVDNEVIHGLGEQASQSLMKKIKMIEQAKLKRFTYIPTRITMSTIIVILGFALSVILKEISVMKGM